MKYRLVFRSAGALDIQISSITRLELQEAVSIDDAQELFYHIQGIEADVYNAIGVPADNYSIEVFELDDFDAEIGDPIVISTGDLQLVRKQLVNEKKINAPGIIMGSITNGRGICGHIDLNLPRFDLNQLKLIETGLEDFGCSDSLCSKIVVLDNEYSLQHSLFTDISPKVEMPYVGCIDSDGEFQTLFDEWDDGWDKEAVIKAMAEKGEG